MAEPATHLLDAVWEYPLFQALYGRRSRRFGLGFSLVEGPYRFKSQHAPVPLSEVEEAVLVAAGIGFSGSAFWEQSRPFPYRAGEGRTFPSTSHGRYTALFFTNDRGVFFIHPAAPPAAKTRTVEDASEREGVIDLYRSTARRSSKADSTSRAKSRRCRVTISGTRTCRARPSLCPSATLVAL